jgi:cytoskeletal protein CcmA (bactofilin family)
MAAATRSSTVIAEDMVVRGDITNGGLVEVKGYVEGSVSADRLLIHESGRVYGTVRAENCDVNGRLQGKVFIKHLINIGNSGAVAGDVRYGQLALAGGGDLDATVRNVPPEIAGDLNVTVRRGHAVRITTADLNAIDPDSAASSVNFTVSGAVGGHIAKSGATQTPVASFNQEELEAGTIVFLHDGSPGNSASVALVAADQTGATSGAAKTLSVTVFDRV